MKKVKSALYYFAMATVILLGCLFILNDENYIAIVILVTSVISLELMWRIFQPDVIKVKGNQLRITLPLFRIKKYNLQDINYLESREWGEFSVHLKQTNHCRTYRPLFFNPDSLVKIAKSNQIPFLRE